MKPSSELDHEADGASAHEDKRPVGRRPDLLGRGSAVGYTGAFQEPGSVDIQDVVAAQTARGPV